MPKCWECTDCDHGTEVGPCTVVYNSESTPPWECPCGNGEDCKWILVDRDSESKEPANGNNK